MYRLFEERRDERPKLVLKGTQDGQCEDTRRMAYHVQRKNDYVRFNDTPLLPLFLNHSQALIFMFVAQTHTFTLRTHTLFPLRG